MRGDEFWFIVNGFFEKVAGAVYLNNREQSSCDAWVVRLRINKL